MHLVLGTLLLRPYVFAFLLLFLGAGALDLGWRRTLKFGLWVWPLAWLAEFASTRVGVPFGLYHYTGVTRGQELYIADVPFMDSLSFTFLAYASFCLARVALAGRKIPNTILALLAGFLMMALDVVIDPLAVRGDRWFLGRIFYYPTGGVYFGVPLSNFAGWWLVGAVGVAGYLGACRTNLCRGAPRLRRGASERWGFGGHVGAPMSLVWAGDGCGRRPTGGVALYYGVLTFNLVLTAWIGEWLLVAVGLGLHAVVAVALAAGRGRGAGKVSQR